MAVKQQKVAMPMSSAGIIGFSSDIKLSGIEFDPKAIIVVVFLLIIGIKLLSYFLY